MANEELKERLTWLQKQKYLFLFLFCFNQLFRQQTTFTWQQKNIRRKIEQLKPLKAFLIVLSAVEGHLRLFNRDWWVTESWEGSGPSDTTMGNVIPCGGKNFHFYFIQYRFFRFFSIFPIFPIFFDFFRFFSIFFLCFRNNNFLSRWA